VNSFSSSNTITYKKKQQKSANICHFADCCVWLLPVISVFPNLNEFLATYFHQSTTWSQKEKKGVSSTVVSNSTHLSIAESESSKAENLAISYALEVDMDSQAYLTVK
jgi:hypothetical protein